MDDTLSHEPSEPRKRVTIYDVAKEAGVAPSTVSRAFSRPGRVNAETSKKIYEVAEELGYRSQSPARLDTGKASKILAFVVSDINNPFLTHIMRGFQQEASMQGYTTLLIDSQESDTAERQSIERILHLVDGVVLTSSRMSDSTINQIVKVRPVVAINRDVRGVPSILPDTDRGIRQAVELLASHNYRRLMYLAGPESSWADGVRWRALTESCDEVDISLRRTGPYPPSLTGGMSAAKVWIRQQYSAVMAYNDLLAIGFMKAVQNAGFNVPGDVSVVGMDNTITTALTTPTLTTVATPPNMLGVRAARTLIYQLQNRSKQAPKTVVVPMNVFLRESVGPVPHSKPTPPMKEQ